MITVNYNTDEPDDNGDGVPRPVELNLYDDEKGPDSPPDFELIFTEDEARDLEDQLRAARLAQAGKKQLTVAARDVCDHDVIPSLGMTVLNVLTQAGDKVVLQDWENNEVIFGGAREVTVLRTIDY